MRYINPRYLLLLTLIRMRDPYPLPPTHTFLAQRIFFADRQFVDDNAGVTDTGSDCT